MPARKELKETYGRLTVLSRNGDRAFCRCKCGKEKEVRVKGLRDGVTRSCGCLRREVTAAKNRRHGFAQRAHCPPEYHIWKRMRQRCNDPNSHEWDNYGGRGIKVSARWDDFSVFLSDMGPRPSPKHQLDRYPNNDGDYRPGNVRWANLTEQARNKRNTIRVTYNSTVVTLADLADLLALPYGSLYSRYRRTRDINLAIEGTRYARKNGT
jgi:hypothetical protein